MDQLQEHLISLPTIIALLFWLVCVVSFSIVVVIKRKELWEMVLGADGKMQPFEAILHYWLFLFPIAVFTIVLIAILGIKIESNVIELIKWVLGCLEAVLFSLLGYDILKLKDSKSNTKKDPG